MNLRRSLDTWERNNKCTVHTRTRPIWMQKGINETFSKTDVLLLFLLFLLQFREVFEENEKMQHTKIKSEKKKKLSASTKCERWKIDERSTIKTELCGIIVTFNKNFYNFFFTFFSSSFPFFFCFVCERCIFLILSFHFRDFLLVMHFVPILHWIQPHIS